MNASPLVKVIWDDACNRSDIGWNDADDVEIKHQLVMTVGFMVKETPEHIIICSTKDMGSDNVNGHFQIPKGMVKSIKVLKLKLSGS